MKWKNALIGLVIMMPLLCGVILAEGKGKGNGKKTGLGQDKFSQGALKRKGDNKDDLRSGKIDRIGDGNSGQGDDLCRNHKKDNHKGDLTDNGNNGQKSTRSVRKSKEYRKGSTHYDLSKIKSLKYHTKQKHHQFGSGVDPSVIETDIELKPVWQPEEATYRIKAIFRNIKVNFWDNHIAFNYDFNKTRDQCAAWNELYLALSLSERNQQNNIVDMSFAARALNYDELLLTLGYVVLCNQSFIFNLSPQGEKIDLVDVDKRLTEALAYFPATKERARLKKMLSNDILKNLQSIFPSLSSAKHQKRKQGSVIKYSCSNEQEIPRDRYVLWGDHKDKESFEYGRKCKFLLKYHWSEDSKRFALRSHTNDDNITGWGCNIEGRSRESHLMNIKRKY